MRPELSSLYAWWLLKRRDTIHNENVAGALIPWLEDARFAAADSVSEFLSQSMKETVGQESADVVQEIHAAVTVAFPRMESELATRQSPLKMQWDARGPGMLNTIRKSLIASGHELENRPVDMWLVQPWSGGRALLFPNLIPDRATIIFEAVITDVIPELPEVVRIAWAISRLSCRIDDNELIREVITAAASVGLVQENESTVDLAKQEWF